MARAAVGLAHAERVPGSPRSFTQKDLAATRELILAALTPVVDLPALARGRKVLVKPNLVRPDPLNPLAIVTDLRVILAVVGLLREAGAAEVAVGDNPGYGLSLSEALCRLDDFTALVETAGGRVVCFDLEDPVVLANPGALVFDPVALPRAAVEAELLVNLPKMKTHVHTLVTLGIKNLYGLVLDDQRMFCHRNDISAKVVDMLRLVRPGLTILDAIVAVQGQAPLSGSVVPDMNAILAGTDVAAVDAVGCLCMGIEPDEVAMLRLVRQEGLGVVDPAEIAVFGPPIEAVARRFRRPVIGCMGAYPQVRCLEGGACRGCLSALRHSLDKLASEGRLSGQAPVEVYLGKPMPDMRHIRGDADLWCFGSCAADLVFDHARRRPKAAFIPGCPPHILEFYKAYLERYGA